MTASPPRSGLFGDLYVVHPAISFFSFLFDKKIIHTIGLKEDISVLETIWGMFN